jgi:Immunity protein 30
MDDAINELLAAAKLESPRDVGQFDASLARITPTSLSREDVRRLLDAFDDKVRYIEVAWGLLHLVEAAPTHVYIPALVEHAAKLRDKAPEFFEALVARCINNVPDRPAFIASLKVADAECRTAVVSMLRSLQAAKPDRASASASEVIALLGE